MTNTNTHRRTIALASLCPLVGRYRKVSRVSHAARTVTLNFVILVAFALVVTGGIAAAILVGYFAHLTGVPGVIAIIVSGIAFELLVNR